MLIAKDVVNKPEILDKIKDTYEIINDSTNTGTLNNLNKALNIMAKKGWKCVGISTVAQPGSLTGYKIEAYAVMEKQ